MKKLLFPLLGLLLILSSCKKDKDDDGNSGATAFEAKINGTKLQFDVLTATLVRSTATNQKRMDIQAVSKDGKHRIILTFGEETSVGNTMTVKNYKAWLFNEDNPNTPVDESEDSLEGFTTYSTSLGNNNWLTDTYAEQGTLGITACNEGTKKVSGTFSVNLLNIDDGSKEVELTEGKFNNVTYLVVN